MLFSRLKCLGKFIYSTITRFIPVKVITDQPVSSPADANGSDLIHIVVSVKDRPSADILQTQMEA